MNKYFLVLCLIFTSFLFGEEFTFTSEQTSLSLTPTDTTIVMKAVVKNTSNQNLDIYAVRSIQQMPRSWKSSMCFGLCYGEDINQTNAITFYPGDEITFELDVHINSSDEGLAKIDISMEASNGESISIIFDIISSSTGIKKDINVADKFLLFDNYPNPFNPETTIRYSLSERSEIEINVYDILGNHVSTLVEGTKSRGVHHTVWNGQNDNGIIQSAGIYYYQMRILQNGYIKNTTTKKMVLMK